MIDTVEIFGRTHERGSNNEVIVNRRLLRHHAQATWVGLVLEPDPGLAVPERVQTKGSEAVERASCQSE